MSDQQHDPTAHDDDRTDNQPQTEDTRVIQTDQAPTEVPATEESAVPPRPTGPHLPAILLGLACLVVAGLAIAQELGHLQVDWGDVGPLGIVAAGALLVVLGLVGLLTSRRRAR